MQEEIFFKAQPLGKNSFIWAVKTACQAEGIGGSGINSFITTPGLRGTLATLLFEHVYSDSSVALRTGNRDPRSLKSYQHLRGGEGLKQRRDILGGGEARRGAKDARFLKWNQRVSMAP